MDLKKVKVGAIGKKVSACADDRALSSLRAAHATTRVFHDGTQPHQITRCIKFVLGMHKGHYLHRESLVELGMMRDSCAAGAGAAWQHQSPNDCMGVRRRSLEAGSQQLSLQLYYQCSVDHRIWRTECILRVR